MTDRHCIDPQELPDSILVELIADGDADAFAIVTRRYAGLMRSVALRYTRNSTDTDDVVQEALVVAWQKIKSLQDAESLRPWLLRLTARKAIDAVRTRHSHVELDEELDTTLDEDSPDNRAIHRAGLDQLDKALLELPVEQARAWVLRHGAGMSYFEIGRELGVSTSTIRGRLARARQTLMKRMEEWKDV